MRIDEDQRIMRRTATQGSGSRVKDAAAVTDEFHIPHLLFFVGVMPDEEVPPHGLVLGGKGMKRGNLVIFGETSITQLKWITARLEQQNRAVGFGKTRGE